MKKWRVWFSRTLTYETDIEAVTVEEAIEELLHGDASRYRLYRVEVEVIDACEVNEQTFPEEFKQDVTQL